jgi:hypothetical protein
VILHEFGDRLWAYGLSTRFKYGLEIAIIPQAQIEYMYMSRMPDALRGQYLEVMGVEVWYSKPVMPAGTVPASGPVDLSATGTTSSFSIAMLQYQGCLMVFDLAEPVEKLATEHQRLLDDMALSLGIDSQQSRLFQEDLPGSSGEDQAQVIQRRAGQLIGDHGSLVLVMGDVPRRLLFGDQIDAMVTTKFQGRRAITAMALDVLIKDPISKKSLWLKMQEPA